jgi:hypothetical protein
MESTRKAILFLLNEVARNSGNVVPSHVSGPTGDVAALVKVASEIALQFGIQEGQLKLIIPEHGDVVQIGDKFHDCRNGAKHKGSNQIVDIVTLPGFSKVGKSAKSELVYVPCEIYNKT